VVKKRGFKRSKNHCLEMTSLETKDKTVEVFSARDKLSGALNLAIDKLGGEDGAHGFFGSPVKRLQSLDSPLGSPTKSPRPRRRRKKEGATDSAFHHTFVMKLFDRSVDLAQFQEGTSLYPVCRAWMKNQPHNTSMAPRVRTPTPEPMKEEIEDSESILKDKDALSSQEASNASGDCALEDMKNKSEEGGEPSKFEKDHIGITLDSGDSNASSKTQKQDNYIYKMPIYEPLKKRTDGEENLLRIPEPIRTAVDLDFFDKTKKDEQGAETPPTHETLLSEHMVRWYKVRKRWKTASAKNEERYKGSMNLLKDMFEK